MAPNPEPIYVVYRKALSRGLVKRFCPELGSVVIAVGVVHVSAF
jgi:hypothetical protein